MFQLKYDDKWLHMYELAKVSLNNRGNEIKSVERRSLELRDNNCEVNGQSSSNSASGQQEEQQE